MRKSPLRQANQDRHIEHFVSGSQLVLRQFLLELIAIQ